MSFKPKASPGRCSAATVTHLWNVRLGRSFQPENGVWQDGHPQATKTTHRQHPAIPGTLLHPWADKVQSQCQVTPWTTSKKNVCVTFKNTERLGDLNHSERLCFVSLRDTLRDAGCLAWLSGWVTALFFCPRSKRVKGEQPFLHSLPLIPLIHTASALTEMLTGLHTCKQAHLFHEHTKLEVKPA